MTDEITASARIYTDVQGLKKLQYANDNPAARKEIAQQFEAMMVQMVMRSMREATKSFSSGLFSNNQLDFYQEMFDNQLSLVMSNSNLGLAKIIEKNIEQMEQLKAKEALPNNHLPAHNNIALAPVAPFTPDTAKADQSLPPTPAVTPQTQQPIASSSPSSFNTSEEFISKLWSTAKTAAHYLGTSPEILLAQAALETNWGKKILPSSPGQTTHNLFNIKADSNWQNHTVINTVEQKDGILVKEKSKFKIYQSFKESFMDYVHFLKNNARYNEALGKASDPQQFIKALHEAGYATDPSYSDKVLKIYSSKSFQQLIDKVRNI